METGTFIERLALPYSDLFAPLVNDEPEPGQPDRRFKYYDGLVFSDEGGMNKKKSSRLCICVVLPVLVQYGAYEGMNALFVEKQFCTRVLAGPSYSGILRPHADMSFKVFYEEKDIIGKVERVGDV